MIVGWPPHIPYANPSNLLLSHVRELLGLLKEEKLHFEDATLDILRAAATYSTPNSYRLCPNPELWGVPGVEAARVVQRSQGGPIRQVRQPQRRRADYLHNHFRPKTNPYEQPLRHPKRGPTTPETITESDDEGGAPSTQVGRAGPGQAVWKGVTEWRAQIEEAMEKAEESDPIED